MDANSGLVADAQLLHAMLDPIQHFEQYSNGGMGNNGDLVTLAQRTQRHHCGSCNSERRFVLVLGEQSDHSEQENVVLRFSLHAAAHRHSSWQHRDRGAPGGHGCAATGTQPHQPRQPHQPHNSTNHTQQHQPHQPHTTTAPTTHNSRKHTLVPPRVSAPARTPRQPMASESLVSWTWRGPGAWLLVGYCPACRLRY